MKGIGVISETIEAIVKALPDDARTLFARLGLHPSNTFSSSALAALAGVRRADVDPPLRTLLDRQLLAPGPALAGGETFVLPEVVQHRAAAATRTLPPQERDDARRGLYLGYYIPTASAAARLLEPERLFALDDPYPSATAEYLDDIAAAREWFDREHDALLLIFLTGQDDGCPEAVHLGVDRTWPYWLQGRSGKHVVAAHRAGLRAARACDDHRAVGRMLTSLALILPAADATEALSHLTEAEDLFRAAGEDLFAARTLHYRGLIHAKAGRPEAAAAHRAAVPECVRLGEPRVAGLALDRLARLAHEAHDYGAAAMYASVASHLLTNARDPMNAALANLTWGEAELACGRPDIGERLMLRAVEALSRNYPQQLPDAFDRLARWYDARGDATNAASYRAQAAALHAGTHTGDAPGRTE